MRLQVLVDSAGETHAAGEVRPAGGGPGDVPRGAVRFAAVLFDAVLFDMDGTLLDSTPAVNRCWTRWADEHAVEPSRLGGFHGQPSAQIVATLMPPEQVPAALARIDALEIEDTEGVVPLPGALEALAALPADRVAIVTSCTRALAEARLAASGLPRPRVVVTADDISRGKPDPEPYLLGAELLGVDPAECLVVEDAPSGLAAGRAAGCTTLAVTTTHPAEQLRADVVVRGLSDLRWDEVRP